MSRLWILAFAPHSIDRHGEETAQTRYAICLESFKRNRFFKSSSPQSVIFDSRSVQSGIDPAPENNRGAEPALKVLVAHTNHFVSPSKVHGLLRKAPASESPATWLDSGLSSLQDAGLLDSFSCSKFREWMDDALQEHLESRRSETLELDYASLLKNSKRTKQMLNRDPAADIEPIPQKTFLGFWISSPYGGPREQSFASERRRDPYGGLM